MSEKQEPQWENWDPNNPPYTSFLDDPKLIKMGNDIYIYPNLLDDSLHNDCVEALDGFDEKRWWNIHYTEKAGDAEKWAGIISPHANQFYHINDAIRNYIAPMDYWTYGNYNLVRTVSHKGKIVPLGMDQIQDKINKDKLPDYMCVLFLGDFEGGDLYFKNFDLTVKASPKDMVFWPVNKDGTYDWIINEVTKGTKYSYVDYFVKSFGIFQA